MHERFEPLRWRIFWKTGAHCLTTLYPNYEMCPEAKKKRLWGKIVENTPQQWGDVVWMGALDG